MIKASLALLLAMVFAGKSHAMAGDFKNPGLAFPETMPTTLRTQLMAALNTIGVTSRHRTNAIRDLVC